MQRLRRRNPELKVDRRQKIHVQILQLRTRILLINRQNRRSHQVVVVVVRPQKDAGAVAGDLSGAGELLRDRRRPRKAGFSARAATSTRRRRRLGTREIDRGADFRVIVCDRSATFLTNYSAATAAATQIASTTNTNVAEQGRGRRDVVGGRRRKSGVGRGAGGEVG